VASDQQRGVCKISRTRDHDMDFALHDITPPWKATAVRADAERDDGASVQGSRHELP
jgi:hypothetical protein